MTNRGLPGCKEFALKKLDLDPNDAGDRQRFVTLGFLEIQMRPFRQRQFADAHAGRQQNFHRQGVLGSRCSPVLAARVENALTL